MGKRKTFGVLGLGLAGATLYRRRHHLWERVLHLPPAASGVVVRRTIRLPMRDGVLLSTDHYVPNNSAPGPTILIRTPYGRAGLLGATTAFVAQRFAERGYHVVTQDVRGRFDSDGTFLPFMSEADDGATTLEWLMAQPWNNGAVGMWGPSYLGYVQWATAVTAAERGQPGPRALMPILTRSSGYPIVEGGLALEMSLRWLLALERMTTPSLFSWASLGPLLRAGEQQKLLDAGYQHLPLGEADVALLGHPVSYYRDWVENLHREDDYYRQVSYGNRLDRVRAAVHLIGGWYDIFLDGMMADYHALHSAGRRPYLTIGPWHHLSIDIQLLSLREGIAWFDTHLRDLPARRRRQPVRVYVMGAERWHDLEAWPPPSEPRRYFLHANGRLLHHAPPAGTSPDRYRYDPVNPTPQWGGALMSAGAGVVDNRSLEARADVLTYTTEPLSAPLEIMGRAEVTLHVASTRPHTDFFVRLCDVAPDGRSRNICDGQVRLDPAWAPRGEDGRWTLTIPLADTAYLFKQGHAIRLVLSSGAHPRVARNPGTGAPLATATRLVAADQTVYHDATHPSALTLPVTRQGIAS